MLSVVLNIYPVQYIPKVGELYYFEDITVNVYTETQMRAMMISSAEGSNYRNEQRDRKRVADVVDNPEFIADYNELEVEMPSPGGIFGGLDDPEEYDYLIITNEELRDSDEEYNFQYLMQSKEDKGLATKLVTVEEIYGDYEGDDDQDKIRNFIKDAYANWGITYVLLGGDGDGADIGGESGDNIIPARLLYADAGEAAEYLASDVYYACLDGTFDYDEDGIYGEPTDGVDGGEVDLYCL